MTRFGIRLLLLCLCFFLLLPSVPLHAVKTSDALSSEESSSDEILPPASLSENEKKALLSALFEADIATLREAIVLRLITCRELTAYYLERIDAYNQTYNCFITICDNALEIADQRDAAIAAGKAKGTLFGIPIVIKDNIDYAGFHTTNGYKKKDTQIADANAPIVENLIAEGAIILAKTNMSTAAQEARLSISKAVGETRNAYQIDLASGGSSGGSCVATSLNFAAGSLGTDTNSSLRYPAALNGCVSLRPTTGLLNRGGIVILNSRRDTPGAITRTVLDQAILLDAMLGDSHYTEQLNPNILSGLRIGILKELSGPVSSISSRRAGNLDKEILAAMNNAVEELRACGAEVIEVSFPKIFTLSNACSKDSSSAKKTFYAAFESLLQSNNIVAVIFPTYLHAPQWRGVSESGNLRVYEQNYVTNMKLLAPPLGLPEISIPIGTHSRGAGIGMEIASLRNSEQLLLDIAYAYTLRYDHRVIPEGAPDLYAKFSGAPLSVLLADYRDSLTAEETTTVEDTTETVSTDATAELPDTIEPPITSLPAPTEKRTGMIALFILWIVLVVIFLAFVAQAIFQARRHRKRQKERRPPISPDNQFK